MSLFAKFLAANARWAASLGTSKPSGGYALIEANQVQVFYLYSILKIGSIFAHVNGLRPLMYPSARSPRRQRLIAGSFGGAVVASHTLFARCLISRLPCLLWHCLRLRTKHDVAGLEIDGVRLGPYIFDAIYCPLMSGLTMRQRVKIGYYLVCHWMDQAVLDRFDVRLVVIGDPAHRCGMLFELCRRKGIKCISAINPDILQMHKYYSPGEFDRHFRDVPPELLSLLNQYPQVTRQVDDYLEVRFKGAVRQHDVIRAYGSHKVIRTRDQIFQDYGLDPALPLVFVMAHVFSDAPHTYPGTLYTDYEDWLVETVRTLSRNKAVNFLIKEHPTADLYRETGMVRRRMEEIGLAGRLLRSDVHTQTVLSTADAILTCGGTIGIEASVRGIPVVLAARPPYSGKGYTVEPTSRKEYEQLLERGIERLAPLTPPQVQIAKYVAYVMFELFDNDGRTVELGGVPYVWGKPYDEEAFFNGVIEETAVPAMEQRLYQRLQEFDRSPDTSLINYSKLHLVKAAS
jgi:hypothetical protein